MWVWDSNCHKNCQKMVVQLSFLHQQMSKNRFLPLESSSIHLGGYTPRWVFGISIAWVKPILITMRVFFSSNWSRIPSLLASVFLYVIVGWFSVARLCAIKGMMMKILQFDLIEMFWFDIVSWINVVLAGPVNQIYREK
jgi:hypothetical protein